MKELKAQLTMAKQLSKGVQPAGSVDLFNEIKDKVCSLSHHFILRIVGISFPL